jgi:hypothetical protein
MKRLLYALALAIGLASPVYSQTLPTVTLTPSVMSGAGSIQTTLTWSTNPVAQSCLAAGSPSWTGAKAPSGTLALPAITLSGTYQLSLTCSWPGDLTATLHWTQPTTNTDGSALARCATAASPGPCLAYFNIYHGATPAEVGSADMTPVRDPTATSYIWQNLPAGQHCFAVEVVNGDGVPSAPSNITNPCKTTTGAQSVTRTVSITVNPKPSAATALGVQ